MENNEKNKQHERVTDLTNEIVDKLDNVQKKLTERAQEAGYARDLFKNVGYFLKAIPDHIELKKAEATLERFRAFVDAKEAYVNQMGTVVSSAYSTATIIVLGADAEWAVAGRPSSVKSNATVFKPPLNSPPDRTKKYSDLLEKISPSLAMTYRSIWETYFGTTDSRNRNALFSIRQFYDEFFSIIAPDAEVRVSKYYELRGRQTEKVTRRERILYAANTRVKDTVLSSLLISNTSDMLEQYQKLNHLHVRGELSDSLVEESLEAMRALLEQWIDAITS